MRVRRAVETKILENEHIQRHLERIGASWKDVRLCDVLSRGSRRPRVMSPRLDMGNITLNDLLSYEHFFFMG